MMARALMTSTRSDVSALTATMTSSVHQKSTNASVTRVRTMVVASTASTGIVLGIMYVLQAKFEMHPKYKKNKRKKPQKFIIFNQELISYRYSSCCCCCCCC